uniref:Uncharacterized protein n=1 Tax=Ditylum brightwellii TaxID=49249 RepID=A0A7S4RKW6_9STRA
MKETNHTEENSMIDSSSRSPTANGVESKIIEPNNASSPGDSSQQEYNEAEENKAVQGMRSNNNISDTTPPLSPQKVISSTAPGLSTPVPPSPKADGNSFHRIHSSPGLIDYSPRNSSLSPPPPSSEACHLPKHPRPPTLLNVSLPAMRPRLNTMPSELTPVIRNTTSGEEDQHNLPSGFGFVVISPSLDADDMPPKSSPSSNKPYELHRRIRPAPQAAPVEEYLMPQNVPYLPQNAQATLQTPSSPKATTTDADAAGAAAFGDLSPIQITDRKFYSFNGRSQYRRALAEASVLRHSSETKHSSFMESSPEEIETPKVGTATTSNMSGVMRKQYQPSREESLTEIGVQKEDLANIFKPSSRRRKNSTSSSSRNNTQLLLPSSSLKSSTDERDLSIPSIRLANILTNVSTTSFTCSEEEDLDYDDEDEEEVYDDDDTLSSIGSGAEVVVEVTPPSSSVKETALENEGGGGVVIEHALEQITLGDTIHTLDNTIDSAGAVVCSPAVSQPTATGTPTAEPPKRRHVRNGSSSNIHKQEEERKAYEWLQSVNVSRENEFLAEAASSKFLTKGPHHNPSSSEDTTGRSPRSTLVQPLTPLRLNRGVTSPPLMKNVVEVKENVKNAGGVTTLKDMKEDVVVKCDDCVNEDSSPP